MNFEDCTPLPALPDESTTPFPTMLPSILSGRKEGKPDLDEERAALNRDYARFDRERAVLEQRADHLDCVAAQLRQQRWLLRVSGFFVGMLLSNLFLLISYLINR